MYTGMLAIQGKEWSKEEQTLIQSLYIYSPLAHIHLERIRPLEMQAFERSAIYVRLLGTRLYALDDIIDKLAASALELATENVVVGRTRINMSGGNGEYFCTHV